MTTTETTTDARAAKVDEYVARHAWGSVLQTIAESMNGIDNDPYENLLMRMLSEAVEPLERELFSADATDEEMPRAPDYPEYMATMTRHIALEAWILAKLATEDTQEYLRERAADLTKLVAERLGDAAGC